MPREYKLFLSDIRTAIEKIERYIDGLDFDQFCSSDLVIDAVIRNFTIIGEAARNIPDEIREKYPDVPWRTVASFGNLLVHEYFRVDLEQTWAIITERLPDLLVQIIFVLEQENDANPA